MPSKSKSKGNAWEREICKFLSDLYGSNFTRVPNSGAYTGGKNFTRKNSLTENQIKMFKGDIIPPDDWNHFNCEAKNYASFPFHHLLFDKEIPLLEDWLQQIKDAANPGDVNILFMKITRVGKFVGFDASLPFQANRFVTYTDKGNDQWKITEFDSFFQINRAAFERAHS